MKYTDVTIRNLKKRGYRIVEGRDNDYIDSWTGRRHSGHVINIEKDNVIYKQYENRKNLYRDVAWARRQLLDIDTWLHI